MLTVKRFPENPIITPADVPPSRPDFEVVCAFNAAAIRHGDEVMLLLRVAERARCDEQTCRIPVLDCCGERAAIKVLEFDFKDPTIDYRDPRVIFTPAGAYLTTISHLRLARSTDGRHFTVDSTPAVFPDNMYETFGCEDPRITRIDDTYYIAYKSIAEIGITVSLATTKDFVTYERKGIIFGPENLDVVLFPEKIHGKYVTFHRPVSKNLAKLNMWLAYSDDLLQWGGHQFLIGVRDGMWDSGRIGASAVPIKTAQGWLEIYHGATADDIYCLGAVLLDLHDPSQVIARSKEPIIKPEAPYEVEGFLGNVIFSCGAITDGDTVTVYYGAADHVMAAADFSIREILASLEPVSVTAR